MVNPAGVVMVSSTGRWSSALTGYSPSAPPLGEEIKTVKRLVAGTSIARAPRLR